MLGNFMGDFVKGNQYNNYPEEVRKGILLHRKIDAFVDKHPIHKKTRDRLRTKYGLYSGIVVDIIYDHFLSKYWLKYHSLPLHEYTASVYSYLQNNIWQLPQRLQGMVPVLIKNDWLQLYGSVEGIERVIYGMSKRTSLPDHSKFARSILEKHYGEIYNEFDIIFNELVNLATDNINLYKFASD